MDDTEKILKQKQRINELRQVSGTTSNDSQLVCFLYLLMRDHLPTGTVEKILKDVNKPKENVQYTNGWLAKYAQDVADELT